MKKLFILAGAALVSLSMNAQRFDLGVNFMTGAPMYDGTFGTMNADEDFGVFTGKPGFGIGGGIEANYWFNDNINAGLEVGFISFGEADGTLDADFGIVLPLKSSATAIPIMIKAQYHFLDDAIRPFAGLGIGYTMWANKESIDASGFEGGNIDLSWDQNGLVISPRAGLLFQASDLIAINLNIQYNIMMNKIDKANTDVTWEQTGFPTETNPIKEWESDATNYLGINIGVLFTLFE